jgi:uncharacterized protein (DUF885 family)
MPSAAPSIQSNHRIERFFETAFEERINRFPQLLTSLGIKRNQDQLDDLSDAKLEGDRQLIEDQLRRLEGFDYASLAPDKQLNYRVFRSEAEWLLKRYHYRFHEYLVSQKFGLHTDFPAFMINMHSIESVQDARDYLARLRALSKAGEQVIDGLDKRARMGIVLPAFLFPQIIDDCRRFVSESNAGKAPEHNVLFEDFRSKLEKLPNLDQAAKEKWLHEAGAALREHVIPVYERLAVYLERQISQAPSEAGACSMPDGENYYIVCLEKHTSTTLTADAIHQLGLTEVSRLKKEILSLQPALGYHGNLEALFEYAREHPGFYHPQTEAGRKACLAELNSYAEKMAALLPQLFATLPQDELLIKAVERHRERTAGLAFYKGPSSDGRRPGIFYVNLYDLRQLPIFIIEALAYHEALPGHHLQFSIANRLRALPTFRRYVDCTAYIEGWGLYSERLAKEIGLYENPWSDFGRLTYELKRACRLVVDTGIHAKAWTRQQAIDYLHRNTPTSLAQVVKEIDRYIVMPGQATSYKIGMEEILKLRTRTQRILGSKFDLRAFHDELLRHGPLPLALLEEQLMRWAQSQH